MAVTAEFFTSGPSSPYSPLGDSCLWVFQPYWYVTVSFGKVAHLVTDLVQKSGVATECLVTGQPGEGLTPGSVHRFDHLQ